ncbi:MAG: alanine racemase, partial [Methanosarcina sp.]
MKFTRMEWYQVKNIDEIPSPSVLVYPERIERNILKMIEIAGGTERLRPHVKTHKTPEIVKMQMKDGISKFKCATISETEMVASCGAKDILLGMQPVGPNLHRFFELRKNYRSLGISCLADNEADIQKISAMASVYGIETTVWLDINVGMNRTGIASGKKAAELYMRIMSSPYLKAGGLHVYDGHIHEHDLQKRKELCNAAFAPVG